MSLFKGQNSTTKSDKIDSFQATACEFGLGVPMQYGRSRASVNLIAYQDFTSTEHKVKQRSGKSKVTTISYYYNCYLELAIGEAISGIGSIWVGDKKYNSLSEFNSNATIGDGSVKNTGSDINVGAPLQLNKGNNNNPTTYMQTKHPEIAVGYNGLSYLYGFVYLGEDTASVPSYKVEVNGALQSGGDGVDANAADVIRDILQKLGLGNYIDSASFANFQSYCKNADILISTPDGKFKNQTKAHEVVAELLDLCNTYMYWNADRFVFVPRDDREHKEWKPNTQIVYDLSASDLALNGGGIVNFKRKDGRELYNHITVKFINRANEYEQESITFQDVDDIREKGIKSISVEALWLHTKERAVKYAKSLARKYLTEQNQYTLKLDWKYGILTPGDLIRVTDDNLGLSGQVMMVSEVQEDAKGLLTVTAIQRAPGNYSDAKYTITDDYSYQDFNIIPSDTAAPLFIIPPADLITSANGIEIWIAMHGKTASWGGCNVFISDQDGEYSLSGVQDISSTYGTITGNMTAQSSSVSVKFSNPKTVELLTGSVLDAENGNTLIWINGECMSYSLATLTAKNTYTLSGLIRGQYGTKATVHTMGDPIAVLDGGIYVVQLTKSYVGKELYFKLPSFNVFKTNAQSINELDYYTCVAAKYDLPNCQDVTAKALYRGLSDGIMKYDIIVNWKKPSGFASYSKANVFYKVNSVQGALTGVIASGAKANELGYSKEWQCAGSAAETVTIPQAIIGDTYKIAVCTEDMYGYTETPDSSAQTTITIAARNTTPNVPSNVQMKFDNVPVLSWDFVDNADVKFYEIWTGRNRSGTLLARTNTNTASLDQLTSRTGTVYLYAVGVYGKVSQPAVYYYNKPAPKQPAKPSVDVFLAGLNVQMDEIPPDCYAIRLWVNDKQMTLTNSSYSQNGAAGLYSLRYCFVDCFGVGAYSAETTVEIPIYIDPALIEAESITAGKLDKATNEALDRALQAITVDSLHEYSYTRTELENYVSSQLQHYTDDATVTSMIEQSAEQITSMVIRAANLDALTPAIEVRSGTLIYKTYDVEAGKGYSVTTTLNNTAKTNYIRFYNSSGTQLSTSTGDNQKIKSTTSTKKYTVISDMVTIPANAVKMRVDGYDDGNADNDTSLTIIVKLGTSLVEVYSAITQLEDAISMRVVKGDIITGINMGSEGNVAIMGKYLHINGDTVFDSNAIIKGSMQSGSILCDKGVSITGGALTINKNGMSLNKKDGSNVLFNANGIEFKDKQGYTFANVGRQLFGTNIADGKTVTFAHKWDKIPKVMLSPRNLQLASSGWTSSNISIICNASNITAQSFKVNCYAKINKGSVARTATYKSFDSILPYGMTDDYHHYNSADQSRTGTTSYAMTGVNSTKKKTGYTQAITIEKPKGATKVTVVLSWKAYEKRNGAIYPRFYLQNAAGTTLKTYTGFSQVPAKPSGYYQYIDTGESSTIAVWTDTSNGYGQDFLTITATVPANDISIKINMEACYHRYANDDFVTYFGYARIDSVEFTADEDVILAKGTADFICCEVNETNYTVS